jgi:protein-tyrosine phosphatase
MIDIHAHVLPGLDDGPANMGEALALVRAAVDNGIDTIIATPHMLDGIYNATRDGIFAALAELNDVIDEHGLVVTILAGGDVHAETEVPDLLRRGDLVTVADRGKHLMLELPPDVVPRELDQLLFSMQLQGVRPIISHPERNRVIQEDPNQLLSLVQAGGLTQITAASVVGDFGRRVQTCAETLLDRRMAHFVATDMHDLRGRKPKLAEAAARMTELVGEDETNEILRERPEALIHGKYVNTPEPAAAKPRKRWFFW